MLAMLLLLLAGSATAAAAGSAWERVGPRNIFDDEHGRGEAGTLATAASPAENPSLIYAGGQNNGASSGVMKTVDMGMTWVQASNGLFDTRVSGLFVYPSAPGTEAAAAGQHVLCGGASGVYESVDGAASWTLVKGSGAFGQVHTFRLGTIGGEKYVLASTSQGIINAPLKGGAWSTIKSPHGNWQSPLSVAADGPNTMACGCLSGHVVLAAITSPTAATFTDLPDLKCANAAIDPNDKTHFIFSNSTGPNPKDYWQVWESTDGGVSAHGTGHLPGSYYVAIDRQGWYYTGAEAGAYRSMDKGKSWQAYVLNMTTAPDNAEHDRIPEDYQRIEVDFAGDNVAFPSDQGLFIKPPGNDPNTSLIVATGNMSNNIAIRIAVSEGEGKGKNYIVSTVWDWAPIASWDSGLSWPATTCNNWNGPGSNVQCDKTVGYIGEGGAAYGFGKSNHMVMVHYHNIAYSSQGGKFAERYELPQSAVAHNSVVVYGKKAGSRSEPDGTVYTVMDWDGKTDAVKASVGRGKEADEEEDEERALVDTPFGEVRDVRPDVLSATQQKYVLKSADFGQNWTWTAFPDFLQSVSLIQTDPTDSKTIYAVAPACLSTSVDQGANWSPCIKAAGLSGAFVDLIIKDATTMVMLRSGDVPLRTKDGGRSWAPLASAAGKLPKGGTSAGSYSWSGKTLVIHGKDMSAPARGEYAGYVIKSQVSAARRTPPSLPWLPWDGSCQPLPPPRGALSQKVFL